MAVTSTTFLTRFPEFSNLETAVVEGAIAEAQRFCSSEVWGDQHDDGVNYLSAHLLASRTQAIGQQIGAVPGGSSDLGFAGTAYGATFSALQRNLVNTGFAF
jgi:hypothetical protein